jgi:hypothetical protein
MTRKSRRGSALRRTALVLGCLLIVLALWVGVRGALAVQQLSQAVPLATALKADLISGDTAQAQSVAKDLSDKTASAVSLTGDVGWALTEFIPFLGANLQAVRIAAQSADILAAHVVTPLIGLTDGGGVKQLAPRDGRVDYSFLQDAESAAAAANGAAVNAQALLATIDRQFLIAPVDDAVVTLTGVVDSAASAAQALNALTHLTPRMLGADAPRNTLLVFQNPAELRATGGLMGAMALIHSDAGAMTLVRQATAGELNQGIDPPLAQLSDETKAVFGLLPAQLISDANVTPDFAQSAQIVSAVWERTFGDTISSVISVDPVALGYILAATGPIELPNGMMVSEENAVSYLLTDVYFDSDVEEQNIVFASVAAAVFDRIASGQVDAPALLAALVRAGDEHRVFLWNADSSEQDFTAGTTLQGLLPNAQVGSRSFGLYFNDATASKMDPYLTTSVQWGVVEECRNDGRATAVFEVTMTNTAPANAGETFPPSVTGAGAHGTPAGSIRTAVIMYGARDGVWGQALLDGQESPLFTVTTSQFATATHLIELAPGQSTKLTFRMLLAPGASEGGAIGELLTTPALNLSVEKTERFDCGIGLR